MNNYRDRALKPTGEAYNAADFALCYQCHGEAPYMDPSVDPRGDTGFALHGYHLGRIGSSGSGGVDIDHPGDGQGNALCAECHIRTHGQGENAVGNPGGTRLVNLAPDVQPTSLGALQWDPAARTCSLTCHGKEHNANMYNPAP